MCRFLQLPLGGLTLKRLKDQERTAHSGDESPGPFRRESPHKKGDGTWGNTIGTMPGGEILRMANNAPRGNTSRAAKFVERFGAHFAADVPAEASA